jgi:hypothetical protein
LVQAYQAINIRLVLTALEIQETDAFVRSEDSNIDIDNYGYHVEKITKTDGFKDLSIDHAFLLRLAEKLIIFVNVLNFCKTVKHLGYIRDKR